MAEKKFAINHEPHVMAVGETRLLLEPEVIGAEFAEAYSALRTAQQRVNDAGDDVGAEELGGVHNAMRTFVRRFLLEESKEAFDALRLPDRVLVQMLEFTAELYGSGLGNGAGGPSTGN